MGIEEGIKMCRMRGKYLEIGSVTPNNMINIDAFYLVSNQIKLLSFQHYDPWIIPNAAKFLERTKNKFPLSNVISHQYPLEDINHAFQESDWMSENSNSGSVTFCRILLPDSAGCRSRNRTNVLGSV